MPTFFEDYEVLLKSGLFDAEHYLTLYPDLEVQNIDPLVHYLEEGAQQGRSPHPDFDVAFYLEQCSNLGEVPDNPLLHFIRHGLSRGLKARPDIPDGKVPAGDEPRLAAGPDAGRSQESPILLVVESLGVAAPASGGLRLSVNGWALARSLIAEITGSIAGQPVGTAVYGLSRPDVADRYPDHSEATQSGFILSVDLPPQTDATLDLMLSVVTSTGEVGQRSLHVEIPPEAIDLDSVDPHDPSVSADALARPSMELFVDRAHADDSAILRVEGWVVCLVQIEVVEVFIGNERVGEAEFGRVRDDIGIARSGYPNARFSGFFLAANVAAHGPGKQTITVRALARTGISRTATADINIPSIETPVESSKTLRHHVDEAVLTTAGNVALKGWVVADAPMMTIEVFLDGEVLGNAEAGIERPDVGNHFPDWLHARQSGFQYRGSAGHVSSGEHLLTLRFVQSDGEVDQIDLPVGAVDSGGEHDAEGTSVGKLHLDTPTLIGGAMETPLRGNLEIGGWALARSGVAAIEIAVDDVQIAVADYGIRRLDIQAAFPDWDNALSSGFQALLPHRVLPVGTHRVTVTLRDKLARTASIDFRIEVEPLSDALGPWSLRRKMPLAEISLGQTILARRGPEPRFYIVLLLTGDADALAKARVTVASLEAQAYRNWDLLIVAPSPRARRSIQEWLAAEFTASIGNVEVVTTTAPSRKFREGTSATLFVMRLAPGDELGCDALLEFALAAAAQPEADFIYCDERGINPATGVVDAFFKPDWSPDLLLSTNYVGRAWCVRADLLNSLLAPHEVLPAVGDYDLVLRCTEAARAVCHVPAVLCQPAANTTEADADEQAALDRALARRGIDGEIEAGRQPGAYRLKRAVATEGMVSIIIPTRATRGLIKTCIETLCGLTAYRNFEIVCIENIPPNEPEWREWLLRNADTVVSTQEPFNWSRFNNLAAAQATGEFLLFLNDDIEIVEPGWLRALLEHGQRPEVGVVGPQLLYPDRRVQHAGMFLAAMGQGRHAFRYAAEDDPGYFGLALAQRNVTAVTGACLLTRRETFDALGGFDEAHGVVNNDLDYCLRAWTGGLVNIYTPHATLIHHEAVSRADLADEYDEALFESRWRNLFLAGDPYFNTNLMRHRDDFSIDAEPNQTLFSGGATIGRDEVRRILIVKLDHIGDCIIAFPAVRRLKQHFPEARFTVLTSRSSRAVWSMEPVVEEIIEFDFFHPRSALGLLERSEADWRELRDRLAPYQFDLAIDLRKHPETRSVLQYTGARYLAGFDHRNQFAWLDIALDWGGDFAFARKRTHTAEDLLNLADAVAEARNADRTLIAATPPSSKAVNALGLKKSVDRPLVCVHPMAGNVMKQWPVEFFAALIDRLVEEDKARVVLIGGPGDEEIADTLLQRSRQPRAVISLVGKLPLGDLPALLAEVALFVGNDSGPKHIAAGLGVPTVGIHSGTIDPREWGPVGPFAVAVAREVVCSPCYLSQLEDCRRNLACLRQLSPDKVYAACKRLLLLNGCSAVTERTAEVTTATKPRDARHRSNRTRATPRRARG